MEIMNLEELMNDVYADAVCETVNTIGDLYHDTCDIVMDILEEEGITVSERCLIASVLELHSDILNDLVNEEFGDEDCCDGDCANCPCAEEE